MTERLTIPTKRDEEMTSPEKLNPIFVTYRLLGVSDGAGWPSSPEPEFGGNGLVQQINGGAFVFTGIHTGPVRVEVRRLAHAPQEVDSGPWEEIVEVSASVSGPLRLRSLEHSDDGPVLWDAAKKESIRIRVYAKGRDIETDEVVEEPVEDYLFEIWADDFAPEVIHRQTDECGAEFRDDFE